MCGRARRHDPRHEGRRMRNTGHRIWAAQFIRPLRPRLQLAAGSFRIVSTPLPINFTRTGTTVIGLEIIFVARTPPRFGPRIVFNYQLHPPPQLYAIQHANTVIVSPTMVPLRCGFPNNCAENESEGWVRRECVSLPKAEKPVDSNHVIGNYEASSSSSRIRGEN